MNHHCRNSFCNISTILFEKSIHPPTPVGKKIMTGIVIIMAVIFLWSLTPLHAAPTARETMQQTIDEVLSVLKDPTLKGDSHVNTQKEQLRSIMDRTFNYTLLSRQALGRAWKEITPEQQNEFVRLYRALLANTYMDRMIAYGDEKVEITRDIPLSDTIFEVQTTIHSQNGEIPVFYRLNRVENQWQVFDVVIEGVSLTKNYRSQFTDFLAKKSMDDLLRVLRKKGENRK